MKVIRAKHAGACYGVQRALDMALEAASRRGPVYTLGPLIHNPGVVENLAEQGVAVVEDVSGLKDGVIIIRSHGVTPDVRAMLDASELEVVDATCPHVSRAQKAAAQLAREGCRVIVVGEKGHPEVEGLMACASGEGAKVDVVSNPDEVPSDLFSPIGIVVQTTQRRENLDAVLDRIEALGITPQVKNTICTATTHRQDAAKKLAGGVDAMVVIGGRNSSNTTRLAEICNQACGCAYHVESVGELDPAWFSSCDTVGVTAGASTPEAQINAVVEYLESL